jgi:hypothetical protein
MAKKKKGINKKVLNKDIQIAWHYVLPCLLGGAIAWVFSGSLSLAIQVAVAVLIGNYIGQTLSGKNK